MCCSSLLGFFYYFDENEVKALLIRVADHFPGSEILFDVSSPYGIKVANKEVIRNSGWDEKSFLKWGVTSLQEIVSWDKWFHLLNTYWYFGRKAKSLWLNVRLVGALSDLLKVQYMVHLGIDPA